MSSFVLDISYMYWFPYIKNKQTRMPHVQFVQQTTLHLKYFTVHSFKGCVNGQMFCKVFVKSFCLKSYLFSRVHTSIYTLAYPRMCYQFAHV